MFLLYVVFFVIFVGAKAFYVHNRFCYSLPFLEKIFYLWKIILLPHYEQTLVNAIQTARQKQYHTIYN